MLFNIKKLLKLIITELDNENGKFNAYSLKHNNRQQYGQISLGGRA